MEFNDPKPSLEEIRHYGVKGMRWGVRKDRETSRGSKSTGESYDDISVEDLKRTAQDLAKRPKTKEEFEKQQIEIHKKLQQQSDYDGAEGSAPKGIKKKVIIGVSATLLTAATVAYLVKNSKQGNPAPWELTDEDFKSLFVKAKTEPSTVKPGDKCTPAEYKTQYNSSLDAMGFGLAFSETWDAPDVTVPAGQMFHRISKHPEDSFSGSTYCTPSSADYNRYVYSYGDWELGGAKGLYHVTFKANEDIRIPSAKQRVIAYAEAMETVTRKRPTIQEAMVAYQSKVGGSWSRDVKEVDTYFKILESKGYDAIVDDMDAGVLGEMPLVMFNPKKFSSKNHSVITDSDYKYSGENLTEISNRKKISGYIDDYVAHFDFYEKPSLEEIRHYGVKGMRWGVRKDREVTVELTDYDKKVIADLESKGIDPALVYEKYAPETGTYVKKKPRLSEAQQKALIIGVGAVVAAGGLYAASKLSEKAFIEEYVGKNAPSEQIAFWKDYHKTLKNKTFFDPDKLDDTPVTFKPGDIVKRVSSAKEEGVRPKGFYASFEDGDVERYKANLPCYWKVWAKNGVMPYAEEGYVVNIKAKATVKAPSIKETWKLYEEFATANSNNIFAVDPIYKHNKKAGFMSAAHNWASDDAPGTKAFFDFVRSKGYNALIDVNDVNGLARRPMRFLDGDMWEIDSVDRLSKEAIKAAQENVTRIQHFINLKSEGLLWK